MKKQGCAIDNSKEHTLNNIKNASYRRMIAMLSAGRISSGGSSLIAHAIESAYCYTCMLQMYASASEK